MMQGEAGAAAPAAAEAAAGAAPQAADSAAAAAAPAMQAAQAAAPTWSTESSFWLPENAALQADNVDWLFYGLIGLSAFCFAAITFAVVYFTWKYRARPGHKAQPSPSHNDALEVTWTIIPAIICVFLFVFGWRGYIDNATPPKHGIDVYVTAAKWSWTFSHKNGEVSDGVLHAPVNRPVRLIMTSRDVIHSFFVPAFRIKQDVVPRRYTQIWFEATKPGTYRLYCAEFCGLDHSQMVTTVVIHEPGGYEKYLEESATPAEATKEFGEKLYTRYCMSCHTTDGSARVGPSFKDSYGAPRELEGGARAVADENYIRESILQPQAKIRKGYPPSMTPFQGLLKDVELDSLILFIKSLSNE